MTSQQVFLEKAHEFLKGDGLKTLPPTLLLIGLEKLIEVEIFSCPCTVELNALLTIFIFIGPALFIFSLMYLVLRFLKHRCSHCGGANNNTQQKWPKAVAVCLISPVIWVIILLLDGKYVACAMTDWNGVYVFDDELHKLWCKPTEEERNETKYELRNLTSKYIHQSQVSGYVMIVVVCVLLIVFVGVYDCCISGKCDRCPSQLLCCRRTAETRRGRQDHVETVTGELDAHRDRPSSTAQNQTPSQAAPPPREVTTV